MNSFPHSTVPDSATQRRQIPARSAVRTGYVQLRKHRFFRKRVVLLYKNNGKALLEDPDDTTLPRNKSLP